MPKNLVIVESPAKAKTIEGYLGKDFKVASSYGHVRDLPKGDKAIDIQNKFKPTYEVTADKKEVIKQLKILVKDAEMVYLASDDDREGEAISWHLKEVFVKTGIQVGKIISSPSKRTAQTAEIISSSMNKPIIEFNDRLYDAEVSMILGIIAQTTHLHDCVMLIGHNPAVSALISHVADQRHLNIQPGMMVIIELTVTDWNHVGISTGIVREVLL